MKIAILADIIERVPPKKYGGTERVVYTLVEELVKKGHDVTLFASGDSITSAKLITVSPKSLREQNAEQLYGANHLRLLNVGLAYSMQNRFDVIHDHVTPFSLPTANMAKTPVVATLHGAFNDNNKPLFKTFTNPYLVSISNAQTTPLPNLNYTGTVYNGLNMGHYPYSFEKEGYLLYVGRISPEKGTHNAIEVAKKVGMPLIIAAKLDENRFDDVRYFNRYIKPELKDDIVWIGEVDEEERNRLMSKAYCFLHPVMWPEPFGLTMIESMACGTPVVAFNIGSIPEVVAHGLTGFVVNDVSEMVEAVKNVENISPKFARSYALENFNGKKMASEYEEIYQSVILQKRRKEMGSQIFFGRIPNPVNEVVSQVVYAPNKVKS